ncbi:MAG: cyclopropane-fatty-acyl-phospholipid synthase family protein [Paracoccaceae bacterium]|nr:cyclopropane-fatty-acyl-phospholipid synthase family protein [Paracoccaceae bacterium]
MKLLNAMFRRFVQTGTVEIVDAFGTLHSHKGTPGPHVRLKLHDPKLHLALALNPELRAGEAYMDGTLTIETGSLRDFLTIFATNRGNLRGQPLQKAVRHAAKRLKVLFQRNSLLASRSNVEHHYDLSNELYALFLDAGMNYSCGYFRDTGDSLEVAQQNKLRHIAAKLNLKPGMRVLDIGCGWGGMSMYLAQHCGVEVLGVTLSTQQQQLATARAKDRGLEGRVRFDLCDYRNVMGTFDRIVSIGMFEHVGVKYYPQYFAKIRSLLADDGAAVVHSIGRKGGPGATGAWMRKYIFPGGYSPALSETFAEIEKSGLWVTDVEIWRLHYAQTLLAWETRFAAKRDVAEALLGARFCRMWEFYLIISELSFRHGKHMVFQIQLAKEVGALPLQRDYMGVAEQALSSAGA